MGKAHLYHSLTERGVSGGATAGAYLRYVQVGNRREVRQAKDPDGMSLVWQFAAMGVEGTGEMRGAISVSWVLWIAVVALLLLEFGLPM